MGEIEPHYYHPDLQAQGDCRVCGHGADAPWHNTLPRLLEYHTGVEPIVPPPNRAARLRALMEEQWKRPYVSNPVHRCKFVTPINLGGDHGYYDDLADDSPRGRKR